MFSYKTIDSKIPNDNETDQKSTQTALGPHASKPRDTRELETLGSISNATNNQPKGRYRRITNKATKSHRLAQLTALQLTK